MTANPDRGALARLARAVLRHRRLAVASWLALLVAGAIGAGFVSQRLSLDFSLPGQPGYETAARIERIYGNGGQQPPSILVVTAPAGKTVRRDGAAIASAFDVLRRAEPRLRVVDFASTHDPRFITRDGHTTYAFLFAPPAQSFGAPLPSASARRIVARALPGNYTVAATGLQELSTRGSTGGLGVLAETLVGAAGALAVLAFVFASLLALVPLVVAGVAILTTLLVVLGLTFVADVSFVVEFLVALVGLGVAIDYSLLVVTRWREERARGRENGDAVVAAMTTAGRAVLVSGMTVAASLIALVVLPDPALRSVGIGGMLIPVVSVAVVLTLLPALLGWLGPRVDWPRVRRESHASRAWSAWARAVVRRPALAAGVAIALLALLIIPVRGMTTGETSADALAPSGPARVAYDRLLAGGAPGGVLTPLEVLVRSHEATAARERLASVPGIATAAASSDPGSNRAGTSLVLGIPRTETVNGATLAPVRAARAALDRDAGVIGVAGVGAIELDYQTAIDGALPLVLGLIALVSFLLLARAFRSVVLPLKAIALDLISLTATFGLLTWFWQDGHGSQAIFGIPATGAITFWLPLMIVVFLFGLSMDYEVFILARMREEYDRTGSTRAAVIEGLGRTGRLVTSAALILFLAFAALAAAPNTDIKVFATGLGAGILIDATLVRGLLLPALVALFGRWNWWLPRPLARLVRVPA
jgi:RND superfamily putative drug exporter